MFDREPSRDVILSELEMDGEPCHSIGMHDTPFTAFRIALNRPDAEAPNGMQSVLFLVIAQYQEDAEGAVRSYIDSPCTLQTVEKGDAALLEARGLGMQDGEVRML